MLRLVLFGGLATKLQIKIGTKILITYFILLLITFLITTLVFQILSQKYLINETKERLKIEGELIVQLFSNAPLNDLTIRDKVLNKIRIEIANRYLEAKVIVLNKERKIVYTNLEITDPKKLLQLASESRVNKEYVSVRLPIADKKEGTKGYIILFTKLNDVKALNGIMLGTQMVSMLVAGIVALLIGLILTRSLTNPLKKLNSHIKNFNLNTKIESLNIRTGDEIAELAISYQEMANKLKKYDEQKRSFFQNISHELKTPLMAIQGNAEAIKEGILNSEEVKQSIEVIVEESQRVKKTVEEIIYLTKLESIEEKYEFIEISIGEFMADEIKSFKQLAEQKGIKISLEIAENYQILADNEKLQRVIRNIISNALRYARSLIKIEVKKQNNYLQIIIADDGKGLKNGEEEKVFERFYKGEKGNSGLGLAITKAIIKGHQGEIAAYNNQPAGAVFQILLPIKNE